MTRRKKNIKAQAINTGLADGLSYFSFKPLPNSYAPNHNADPTSQKTNRKHKIARKSKHGKTDHRTPVKRGFNSGLQDGLQDLHIGPAYSDNEYGFHKTHSKKELTKGSNLPNHRLALLENLPGDESTKNYVFVQVDRCQYAYPIHSWVSIMELCEVIYEESYSHNIIRVESRKAITNVVQSYCGNGPFNLIPRGKIEQAVRSHLEERFANSVTEEPITPESKNDFRSKPTKKLPSKKKYTHRVQEYKKRNPHDAKDLPRQTKQFLDEYIAAKSKRINEDAPMVLPGAFTEKKNNARTVWLGLDFGTQNIRAAFRDAETDDQSVVLKLNPSGKGIKAYIISPSIAIQNGGVRFSLHGKSDALSWKNALSTYYGESFSADKRLIEDWLKIARSALPALKDKKDQELVMLFTAVYLAFTLKYMENKIRSYYESNDIYDELTFRVFMCAPVAALNQQLSASVFQDCLTIADQINGELDFRESDIDLNHIVAAYEKASSLGILLEKRPCRRSRVVPEVLAEIASFAQSKTAREGVYALVDIGAGTLDLNIFRIVKVNSEIGMRTPVYAASCHPNGVKHLEFLITNAIDDNTKECAEMFEEQKKNRCFPDIKLLARNVASSDDKDLVTRLNGAHVKYCADIGERTSVTWDDAWQKAGLERKPWKELTMFLCGGGSLIRDMQENMSDGIQPHIISMIKSERLPCPNEEELIRPPNFPEEDFHRVAVAYGLTYGSDFEPYKLPGQIQKVRIRRETIDVESRYISKDMV